MKIYILLILMTLAGLSYAENLISPETQNHINADIALVNSIQQLSQTLGSNGFIAVGADGNCTGINSIQQAIDLLAITGKSEIRVARNKTYNENLIIDDIDVSIIGGYLDCFNMGLPNAIGGPGNNQSIINGGNADSVLKIQSNSQRRTILLKNLQLTNGFSNTGGGLLTSNTNAMISLTNIDIQSNDATFGGGIGISGNDTDMVFINSRVSSNRAKFAGGIHCSGENSSVVLTDKSGITSNSADGIGIGPEPKGNGAGVFIDNCYFAMYSGSNNDATIGIVGNSASGDGGGIYATNNAVVLLNGHENCNLGLCIGNDINPANVSNNTASSGFIANNGGGIYADNNSIVSIYAGLFNSNICINTGGGIYVTNTQLEIGRLKKDCWDNSSCNYIDGNFSNNGGALFSFQSEIDISSTTFENNLATEVIYLSDTTGNSLTRLEGNVFNNNGNDNTESIVHIFGELDVEIVHSTFADNDSMSVFVAESGGNGNPFLQIHSSIFDNANTEILNHNISNFEVNISNIIANEILSLSAANNIINQADNFIVGSLITFDDPMFVDRNNRDYHLLPTSPAIDYAHTPERINVNYLDMDFESRGIDQPNQTGTNSNYFYDLGADEFYASDVIFKNDFE